MTIVSDIFQVIDTFKQVDLKASSKKRAALVTKSLKSARDHLMTGVTDCDYALAVSYCCAVKDIGWRHEITPYDYMTLSRRSGELWEPFCKIGWLFPNARDLEKYSPPTMAQIIEQHIARMVEKHGELVRADLAEVWEFAEGISLQQDAVFLKDGNLFVVDFKSGYGSNEKGNYLRLMNVARAFKKHNPDTKLFLLIRDANSDNDYLEKLKGQWTCLSAAAAYSAMLDMTGVDIGAFCKNHIDWKRDLSPEALEHFQQNDLMKYLDW